MKRSSWFCLLIVFALNTPLSLLADTETTQASPLPTFNRNAILSDDDLFSLGDWNAERIARFLLSKKSGLVALNLPDVDGTSARPADILWRVARSYQVNPKYLLALLQKEQSLIETARPTQKQLDWAMGYAVCDSCSMNDPRIQDFKGFANQVEYAAKQHRERYLEQLLTRGKTIAGQGVGRTMLVNGVAVTPENMATAMLYSYTPHLHGNENLWRIWQRWFGTSLPNGTVIREKGTQTYFLLRRGERRAVSFGVVAGLLDDTRKIVQLATENIEAYPEGAPIRFPNYSLVALPDGTRYLLAGEEKRRIVSEKAFRLLGFQEDEVLDAQEEELASYADGTDLTEKSTYPTGLLARDKRGGYWYIEDDTRHKIPHPIFLKLSFRGRPIKTLSASELSRFVIGEPFRFRDGELVRNTSEPTVYVIEEGLKRPIRSEPLFLALGYTWNNVLTLPDALLLTYPLGEALAPPWKEPARLIESEPSPLL